MGLFPMEDEAYRRVYAREAAMVDAAEAIATALEASGINRSELADRLEVSRSEVTARLRGERNITVRKLAETLNALGAELHLRAITADDRRATSAPKSSDSAVSRWERDVPPAFEHVGAKGWEYAHRH